MEFFFKKLTSRPVCSIICVGLLLFLAGSWVLPLTDRDETRFSEASREMIQRGDYVVPWFNGQWRLYKPVLIYWCQIASYRVLGINDFSARLPSVLFTIGTALLLVCWGRRIADSKTGFIAGAMFLTGLHIAVFGRAATADLVLIFFFTLAAWSGWELTRPQQPARLKWWWIFYVALGLGFLAKGPEAWLPLGAVILGRILRKDSFHLPPIQTAVGIIVPLAIIASWGIPALEQTHGMFWSVGMNEQVYQRAVAINNGHGLSGVPGFFLMLPFYFLTFFGSFFPWSTRVPAALRRWWRERRGDALGWYLLMVAAIVFLVFSLVKTKLIHYTLPAFPCLSLWLALQLREDATSFAWFQKRFVAMIIIVPALMLALAVVARNYALTERLWRTVRPNVRPETKVGCFGYVEPSLVWRFRSVATNLVVLGDERAAKDFLTNQPPFVLVLPTADVASLADTNGLRLEVKGLDMVRFKNRDLTAIVQQ
ncbi:MAG TPA: glycosyltransferase family 39 protein [Alphaproteobacteria bacterium]|nr:glycosyltransferase family 39 protein [Alphaproteobacteria bacterium]